VRPLNSHKKGNFVGLALARVSGQLRKLLEHLRAGATEPNEIRMRQLCPFRVLALPVVRAPGTDCTISLFHAIPQVRATRHIGKFGRNWTKHSTVLRNARL
jgi:hypothetical protein